MKHRVAFLPVPQDDSFTFNTGSQFYV